MPDGAPNSGPIPQALAARSTRRDRPSSRITWTAIGGVAAWFLVLKSFSLHWEIGDENIYHYMTWAFLDHGALPYRDFFFAHPPLHLLPGIAWFGLVGFTPFTVRFIPVGATLVGATFLFLLAKDKLGRIPAIVVVALYLGSFQVLGDSTHWTGVNLAVMWIAIGMWGFYRQQYVASGVIMALGVGTANYVLPAAAMVGLLAFLSQPRAGVRYLSGIGVPWLAIQLGGLALGGWSYVDSVYRFHFLKPAAGNGSLGLFIQIFSDNFALAFGTLLALWLNRFDASPASTDAVAKSPIDEGREARSLARLWLELRRDLLEDGSRSLARVGALWALGYALFIGSLPTVFPFYFLPMFPGLALAAGSASERVLNHLQTLTRLPRQAPEWWEAARIVAIVTLATLVGYLVRVPLQRQLLPAYVRAQDVPMKWSDSPLPVNGLLRWCCWNDVARAYASYGTVQESLYHESRYFEQAQVLADYVRQNSRTDQVLFGDSSTAGLVALLAGRRLAVDFADTNIMRFSSGLTPPDQVIRQIDNPDLAFLLVQAQRRPAGDLSYGGFASLPTFHGWLDEHFQVAFQTDDRTKGTFLLFRHKPETGQ